MCSDTSLTPDDTNQLSTCPLEKDQMWSGAWSVILISNNGNGDPIAYERDFSLIVGLPVTTTLTPTVTVSSTSTPLFNSTVTVPNIISATVNTTVTSPAVTLSPTITITPKRVTVKETQTVATISKTKYVVQPSVVTRTKTASCHVPRRQQHPDPKCRITPTLVSAAALQTSQAKGRFRRVKDRSVPADRAQRIAERKARLARGELQKRAPDNATVTVTDTNTVRLRSDFAQASTMLILLSGRLRYHHIRQHRFSLYGFTYQYVMLRIQRSREISDILQPRPTLPRP